MKDNLTIVVPLYNEEENIDRLNKELNAFLKISLLDTQVLFINDGSSDNSEELIKKICKVNDRFKLISFKKNYGLSAAIKAGFDNAKTSLVGYIDADLQTNPEDFNLLLKEIDNNDLVTGVRTSRKDSIIKNISSLIANTIRKVFTNDKMDDTGCPLKIIRSDFAKKIPMFKGIHRFLPAMILLQKGRVTQVSVRHYPRIAGKAKFGFFNRLTGPLIDCFAYLWMKKKYINYQIKENE
jgi:glycosyltransferase involved in cell wall biosynthesis|tara:strand:+ start:617 stop:1330 length:714 start_codon:yes stop_codon:yes gene_type:complete